MINVSRLQGANYGRMILLLSADSTLSLILPNALVLIAEMGFRNGSENPMEEGHP